MTTISQAALPPIQPRISKKDEAHPLFPLYRQHRNFCSNNLIEASTFRDWLYQYERDQREQKIADDPEFPAFQAWMHAERAGARKCCPTRDMPGGLCFPANFIFWKGGGRW